MFDSHYFEDVTGNKNRHLNVDSETGILKSRCKHNTHLILHTISHYGYHSKVKRYSKNLQNRNNSFQNRLLVSYEKGKNTETGRQVSFSMIKKPSVISTDIVQESYQETVFNSIFAT